MKLNLNRKIPKEFQDDFIAHVLINRAKAIVPKIPANPILTIAGSAGTGKTSNTYALCDALDCQVYPVQGKDLVAQLEGQGSALLVSALQEASRDEESLMPVVLVDDADLGGLGVSENVTGTVNGEAVKGCVMGWADNPNAITVIDGDNPPRRIRLKRAPCMVMTTNRLDHMHPPILREGRSTVIELDPQGRELQEVIAGIYPNLGMRLAGNLMRKFPNQPIAFFVSLKGALAKKIALEHAEKYNGSLHKADWEPFAYYLARVSEGASYQDLVAEGEKIAAHDRGANYIKPRKKLVADPPEPLIGKEGFARQGNGVLRLTNPLAPQPHIPAMKD
ncbi:MAG: AAA family ATPase [Pseudomonadota bacterium]